MKTSIDDSSFLSLEESDSPTGKGGAAGVVLNHGKEKPSNTYSSMELLVSGLPSTTWGTAVSNTFQPG